MTNLGMGLDDGETTSSMRLLGVGPEEVVVLLGGVVVLTRRSWGWAIALGPGCHGGGVGRGHCDGSVRLYRIFSKTIVLENQLIETR